MGRARVKPFLGALLGPAHLTPVGQVEFRSAANRNDLTTLYSGCRAVAVPSRWPAPYGLEVIEARRSARPVVIFDVGGFPDWLRDGKT